MSKKKTAVVLTTVIVFLAAVFAVVYFFVIRNNSETNDYENLKQGMKAWDNSVPGISLYIPEDYEKTENEFYVSYKKDDATVSLTSAEVDNDLDNYAYYAINQYKNVTDSFFVREEYDEELLNTRAHVVEFDYVLVLDGGSRKYSCLTAYVMGDHRVYVLTCISDPISFPLYREDFNRIYKTMFLTNN